MSRILFDGINSEDFLSKLKELIVKIVKDAIFEAERQKKINKEWLSMKETTEVLGVSKPTVYAKIEKGLLTKYQLGRSIRFKTEDVLSLLKEQEQKKNRR